MHRWRGSRAIDPVDVVSAEADTRAAHGGAVAIEARGSMSGTSSSRVRVAIVAALMVLTGLFPGVVAGASPANPAFRDVGTSTTGSWIVTLKAGRDPVRRASTLARSAGGRA